LAESKRILLLLETNAGCFRRCIQGIASFAQSAPEWILYTAEPGVPYDECLRAGHPDAVIARYDPAVAKLLNAQRRKCPVVFVYDAGEVPHVGVDNEAVGRMAATHFVNLGLRHFAFYGFDWPILQMRLNGFRTELAARGHTDFAVFWPHIDARGTWPLTNPDLDGWLKKLPRPAGVFAAGDLLASEVLQRCRHLGIQVPEELAVLGVDNDEMLCAITSPELSSIQTPDLLVGHTAASRLRRILDGGKPPADSVLLQPHDVITRRSTDVIALGDADLAAALAYIRQNADQPIGVEDVIAKVGVSRRSLEMKFKSVLKRTPLDEIRRVHIERARTLLLDWNLPISAVARSSGFESADWLAEVFKRETGLSPTEFRKKFAIPVNP
jgi:LacI family transcriptional regulator